MRTELDKLHKVKLGYLNGRGCGKTFAKVHDLASHVELGFERVFCVITQYRDLKYLTPMIQGIFEERKLPGVKRITLRHWICGDTHIHFILQDELPIYGYNNYCLIEMGHND